MNIAQSKTREQYPLSFKKIIKKTLANVIFIAAFLPLLYIIGVLYIGNTLSEEAPDLGPKLMNILVGGGVILIVLVLLVCILVYFYQRWYFAVYFYDLTEDHVIIRKGPITPKEITIPYERVQDVYVDQDIFDRLFGLYDVHLSSATSSSGMAAHIDGVEKTAADGLRAILLEAVKRKISKTPGVNIQTNNDQN